MAEERVQPVPWVFGLSILVEQPLIVEGVALGNLLPNILGDNRDKRFCNGLCADIFIELGSRHRSYFLRPTDISPTILHFRM